MPERITISKDITDCYIDPRYVRAYKINLNIRGVYFPLEIIAMPNPRSVGTDSDPRYLDHSSTQDQLIKEIKKGYEKTAIISLNTNYGEFKSACLANRILHLDYNTEDYKPPSQDALYEITKISCGLAIEAARRREVGRIVIHCGASKGRTSTAIAALFIFEELLNQAQKQESRLIKFSNMMTSLFSFIPRKEPIFEQIRNPIPQSIAEINRETPILCYSIVARAVKIDGEPNTGDDFIPLIENQCQTRALNEYTRLQYCQLHCLTGGITSYLTDQQKDILNTLERKSPAYTKKATRL